MSTKRSIALLRDIDHDQTLMEIHLCGRQTDAVGCVHGLEHVGNLLADAVIHLSDRTGHRCETGIGITKNRKQCHNSFKRILSLFGHFMAAMLGWPRIIIAQS